MLVSLIPFFLPHSKQATDRDVLTNRLTLVDWRWCRIVAIGLGGIERSRSDLLHAFESDQALGD